MSDINIWAFIDKMTYRELLVFADTIVTTADGEMPDDASGFAELLGNVCENLESEDLLAKHEETVVEK